MVKISTVGLILCFVGLTLARRRRFRGGDDCRGLPDGGVVSWGCRAYTFCQGRRPVIVDCSAIGLVYSPVTKTCDNKLNTPAPCGLYRDCSGKYDGRYADIVTNCSAYYTCNGGKFFGHNQCNPGLIFNEDAQVCDWPFNVEPPCGTKGGVTPKPEKEIRKPSRKMSNGRSNKRKRVKVARRRGEKIMQLKMRLVKEPRERRRQTNIKRKLKRKMMLRETVHGM